MQLNYCFNYVWKELYAITITNYLLIYVKYIRQTSKSSKKQTILFMSYFHEENKLHSFLRITNQNQNLLIMFEIVKNSITKLIMFKNMSM